MFENFNFSNIEKREILNYVRQVVANYLDGAPIAITPNIPILEEKASCFVTCYLDGELRGCIGNIEPFESLEDNLKRNAISCISLDVRFAPLELDELVECRFEVSILSPIKEISSLEEFILGRDGIILKSGEKSALFLPQVPLEQYWDKETTLSYLAKKAGLPLDGWKNQNVQFFTFQTLTFSER